MKSYNLILAILIILMLFVISSCSYNKEFRHIKKFSKEEMLDDGIPVEHISIIEDAGYSPEMVKLVYDLRNAVVIQNYIQNILLQITVPPNVAALFESAGYKTKKSAEAPVEPESSVDDTVKAEDSEKQ